MRLGFMAGLEQGLCQAARDGSMTLKKSRELPMSHAAGSG